MPPKGPGRGRKKVVQEKAVVGNIETFFAKKSPSKKIPDETIENGNIVNGKDDSQNNEEIAGIIKEVLKQSKGKGRLESHENEKLLNGKVEVEENGKTEETFKDTKQGRKEGKLETNKNEEHLDGKVEMEENQNTKETVKKDAKQGRKKGKQETAENENPVNGKVEMEEIQKAEETAKKVTKQGRKKGKQETAQNESPVDEKVEMEENQKAEETAKKDTKQGRRKGKQETAQSESPVDGKVEMEQNEKTEETVKKVANQGRKRGKLYAVEELVVSNSLPEDDVAVSPSKRGRKKIQKSNPIEDNKEQEKTNSEDLDTLDIKKPTESTEEIGNKNEVKAKGTAKRGRGKKAVPTLDETVVIQKSVDSQDDDQSKPSNVTKTVLKTNSGDAKSSAIKKKCDDDITAGGKAVDAVSVKVGCKRKNISALSLLGKGAKKNKAAEKKSDMDTVGHNRFLIVSLKRSKSLDDLASGENDKVTEKGKDAKKPATKRKRDTETGTSDNDSKPAKKLKGETKSKGQSKKDKMPDVTILDFSNTSTSSTGKAWNLKLASWNVNGVRAWLEKDGLVYLKHESPDVMCIQETKCSDDKLPPEVKVKGYHSYWLAGDKDGYSGVGLLSKKEPLSVKYGIDVKEHDAEGRVITAEYEDFYLISAYVPNAGRGLVRLDYRMQWDKDFCSYIKQLDEKKPVILCGDLNVAHEEIDLANPKTNKKNAGFTKEEREGFSTLLSEGFIDTFRHLYPDQKSAYTFWTYMMNARAKNVGWRLDYFVISKRFVENLCDSVIRKDVFGSDHCPIVLFISI